MAICEFLMEALKINDLFYEYLSGEVTTHSRDRTLELIK